MMRLYHAGPSPATPSDQRRRACDLALRSLLAALAWLAALTCLPALGDAIAASLLSPNSFSAPGALAAVLAGSV